PLDPQQRYLQRQNVAQADHQRAQSGIGGRVLTRRAGVTTGRIPMKRSLLLALAALTMGTAGAVAAAAPGAPFGCDARAGQTCFFKIFYGPRATRIVQLPAGMK